MHFIKKITCMLVMLSFMGPYIIRAAEFRPHNSNDNKLHFGVPFRGRGNNSGFYFFLVSLAKPAMVKREPVVSARAVNLRRQSTVAMALPHNTKES